MNITVYSTVQCTVMDHTRIVYSTVTVRCPVQQSTAIVKATLTDLPESKIQALSVRGDVGQLHVERLGGHLCTGGGAGERFGAGSRRIPLVPAQTEQ